MVESEFQEWYKQEIMPSDEELNELEHYGVKGQKWGVRRTPEQLGHISEKKRRVSNWIAKARKKSAKRKKQTAKKKAEAKKAKAEKEEESEDKIREKVLKSTDADYIYKHRKLLTTKELQDRKTWLETEDSIKNISDKRAKKGFNSIKALGEAAKMAESIGKIAENTKKVYDAYSTISSKSASTKFTEEGRNEERRKRERKRASERQEEREEKQKKAQEKKDERDKKKKEQRDREMEKIWYSYMGKHVSSLDDVGLPQGKKKKKT